MRQAGVRDWKATWRKIRQAPKRDLAHRMAERLRRRLGSGARPPVDAPAYALEATSVALSPHPWTLPKEIPVGFQDLADAAWEGSFDLLGSGPVSALRGGRSPGFLGFRYDEPVPVADLNGEFLAAELPPGPREESRRIWRMIAGEHPGIDWGRDLRSGFRWSSSTHHRQIKVMAAPGADLKLPLELGRLQHLPWFALSYAGTRDLAYLDALRTHTLDYIAANPPGWGATWHYAMDAGIRAANLILGVELAIAAGAEFDEDFLTVMARSLVEHGRFIVENLEWHPDRRTNHYLANVAGLAWIATAIPDHGEAASWRAFAEWQFGEEVLAQFLPDGGNFEASTGYHRLSAEMALWAMARLHACSPDSKRSDGTAKVGRFVVPENGGRVDAGEVLSRLARAVQFMEKVTAPDGLALQIGDHDSGRFFKLDGEDRIERSLDFSGTIAAGQALLGHAAQGVNGELMATLLRGRSVAPPPPISPFRSRSEARIAPPLNPKTYVWELGKGVWEDMEAVAFPDFGLYLYRSPRAFLAVRCGPVGQAGYGGHAHNDALAIELFCDGQWLVRDPGSFVYTPSPELRDCYRSVLAHYTPQVVGREPNPLDAGLFRMPERSFAESLEFGEKRIVGRHSGYGVPVYRQVDLTPTGFVVTDWVEGGRLPLNNLKNWNPPPISLGYGHREGS